jgi:hypothetical protein
MRLVLASVIVVLGEQLLLKLDIRQSLKVNIHRIDPHKPHPKQHILIAHHHCTVIEDSTQPLCAVYSIYTAFPVLAFANTHGEDKRVIV